MNRHIFHNKRSLVGVVLIVYVLSYFFQSLLYSPLFAENQVKKTHLVAVFVDKDIYPQIESDVKWYATQYIQSRISDSKALVLPIDTKNFMAKDIVAMLENIYFDGIENASSDLLGAIFIGNIPLPVVQHNGFIYPSIYPYVDFKDQEFIYNANQNYFVYNDNPNGQAEIWHSLLNFGQDIVSYSEFFEKLKTYEKDPTKYIAPRLWYDDLIGMKTTFAQDILPLYINNFVFTEDVGYHRFTNTMLDYFKQIVNNRTSDDIKTLVPGGNSSFDEVSSSVPTLMLSTLIKELVKGYDSLYPGVFLSQIRDNSQSASRWYKQASDDTMVDAVDSHMNKLVLKDSWILGDIGSGVSPLLINYNNQLESALDNAILENKWSLSVPILSTYEYGQYANASKLLKSYCSVASDDLYTNYYFGKNSSYIEDAQELSIYRGTFRNITGLQNESVYSDSDRANLGFTQVLGSSYGVFDTQIEANRGYNLNSAPRENDVYNSNKRPIYREVVCTKRFPFSWLRVFCTAKSLVYVDTDKIETPQQFAQRNRGGASFFNLDSGLLLNEVPEYKLLNYNYKNSQSTIYDMGGAKALTGKQTPAYSVDAATAYSSIIKIRDRSGPLDYPLYISFKKAKSAEKKLLEEDYPSTIWVPESSSEDAWRKFNGNKITVSYQDYFQQYQLGALPYNSFKQIILPRSVVKQWKVGLPLGGKCEDKYSKEYTYTYDIISSIVRNTSPSIDQLNGVKKSKFLDDGIYKKHYDHYVDAFSGFYNQFSLVANPKLAFTGINALITGLYSRVNSFSQYSSNTSPATLLSGLNTILTFSDAEFESQLNIVANTPMPFYTMPDLEGIAATLSEFSGYFLDMKEAEGLDGSKTQFLKSWMATLENTASLITGLASSLPTQYAILRSSYSSLLNADYGINVLKTKKDEINKAHTCHVVLYLGEYKNVCKKIDDIISKLESYKQSVAAISRQIDDNNDVIYPFNDPQLISRFTKAWFPDFTNFLTTLRNRVVLVDQISFSLEGGMNATTKDRPIDSDRNTTFKGLGGELLTFYYPNLYDIDVYTNQTGSLVLKTPKQIENAITIYLINKAKEYNKLLLTQEKSRLLYYTKNKSAFDLLAQSDSLASPNTRTTQYLKDTYFLDKIKDQIPEIAELLYYQSLSSYLRKAKANVLQDLTNIRSSFDVNRKISYIMSGYLTKHNDFGPIVTPGYLGSGYEVAYINTDGNDYISKSDTPDFIVSLQKSQLNNTSSVANNLVMENKEYSQIANECGLDTTYSAALFAIDGNKVSSPWITALKCWWKNIPTSTRFSVTFQVGPSPKEFLTSLSTMFETWKESFKQLSNTTTPVFQGNLGEYWTNLTQPIASIATGVVDSIEFVFPSNSQYIVAGTQSPFTLLAKDKNGDVVPGTLDEYYIQVNEGDGVFVDGVVEYTTSSPFTDFGNILVYQAPRVDSTKMVTLSVLRGDTVFAKKILRVEPPVLSIKSNGNTLYTNKKTLNSLNFTLKDSSDGIPNIHFDLKTLSGIPLDASVTIGSAKKLFTPGISSTTGFVPIQSFLIESGTLDISLMPTFVAGSDILYIEIPGLDRIDIPVLIRPGTPLKVNLSASSSLLKPNEQLTGSVSVADSWGNLVPNTKIKFGAIGPLTGVTLQSTQDSYLFSASTEEPGGLAYLYAYIDGVSLSDQAPDYHQITVQKPFLPEKNLNVMYLNLFGSDWGNQWGYGSARTGYVSSLMTESPKLLAVTTQLIDPNTLKKFVFVVGQDAQVHPMIDMSFSLTLSGSNLLLNAGDVAELRMSQFNAIRFSSVQDFQTANPVQVKQPTFILLEDSSTPTISTTSTQLLSGDQILIDTQDLFIATGVTIQMDPSPYQGYSLWHILVDGKKLATCLFVLPIDTSLDAFSVDLFSALDYGIMSTFADGSTNGRKGIGIYTSNAIFQKEGYVSIEDSFDYTLGVGFTSDFKNITLFGDGASVGDATIPYASPFLINYGDPLLTRISDNPQLEELPLDTGIGNQVYSDSNKTIFKTISADINNDGHKDLVVVFVDGTVKILKNYGGTNPYRDIGELFRLIDGIKDVHVGDIDNNGYADLLVRTDRDQLRAYTNDRGVFDVDGKIICLNTNVDQGLVSQNPSDISAAQTFFEDMDQDGVLDIVTNDSIGDLKIFYGGASKDGVNYLSTLAYTCDIDRYNRQKNSTLLVKRFGLSIDPAAYVQDMSVVHLAGWNIEGEQTDTEQDVDYSSASKPLNAPSFLDALDGFGSSSSSMGTVIGSMSDYLQEQTNTQALDLSPIADFTPSYESVERHDSIGYKNLINLLNDKDISIYKQYQDQNGGVLISGDVVKIKITLLSTSLKPITASYIDRLSGPWLIDLNQYGRISSWELEEGLYDTGNVLWDYDDYFTFVMDNIKLSPGQKIVVSYFVRYQGKPSVNVSVKSIPHPETKKAADKYPDIIVKPDDACKKYAWDFMNTPFSSHRSYEEIFDTSLQDAVVDYLNQGSDTGNAMLTGSIPSAPIVNSGSSTEDRQKAISSFVSDVLGGMSSLTENWTLQDLFAEGGGVNLFLNMDAVDKAMVPVMDAVDKASNALCQGFKLGKSGCQPPAPFNMIPFNQAFLAPGEYHLFGCTPKLPNPLAPVFMYLNKMLGGGMPIMYFPGTIPATLLTPPIPMISTSFIPIPQKGPGDGFGIPGILPLAGGVYPSQIRIYAVPTLTLQMGVAICFGPYALASKIPKLLRDLGGNCIVTAFPLYKNTCDQAIAETKGDSPSTEVLETWMTDLAAQGSCTTPVQNGSTKVVVGQTSVRNTLVSSPTRILLQSTVSSPVYIASRGSQSAAWINAIPNGNFAGIGVVAFDEKPTKVSPSFAFEANPNTVGLGDFSFAGFKMVPGPSIDLKILGPNTKGIIKVFVQDWLSRQVKYIMNNLTKMTISITLPNLADLAQGFDQLADPTDADPKDIQFITSRDISELTGINKIAGYASKQNFDLASDFVNNPFDNLVNMFEEVPLVRLQTKDIVVNVPMITTENTLKYKNYLKNWLNTQSKILKQWVEVFGDTIGVCSNITKKEASDNLADIDKEQNIIRASSLTDTQKQKAITSLNVYKEKMNSILDGSLVYPKADMSQDISKNRDIIKTQVSFLGNRISVLPSFLAVIKILEENKKSLGALNSEDQALLDRLQIRVKNLSSCAAFSQNIDPFISFYSNVTVLVTKVKQNIQVLEEYQKFPLQLSKWMTVADTYLSDITSFLSSTVVVLMQWMSTNAKIYSKYVDALILIISAIKTWQILIDFSVNWSKKCGKCSRDSYGSYNCGLSFLLNKIKLPIIPIPPFKIPNIYVDLSHIDLGMTIQLPKFRFVPMNISLPNIPNIPSPPKIDISTNLDLNVGINSGDFDFNVPNIPVLPSPPILPDLPSFIPKIDFALPTLPPAPKIPNLIPSISTTLDFASSLSKIFCIVKQGVGLVGEKGVKAKVEQLTQRTRDVKSVDFFNKTVSWKKDPPLNGFDFELDGYLQFKIDFDTFYGFLNQIAGGVNSFTTTAQNSIQQGLNKASTAANSAVRDFSQDYLKDIDLDLNIKGDLNLDLDVLKSASVATGLDYDVALNQLNNGLDYFDTKADDPTIKQKIRTVRSIVNDKIAISPSTQKLASVQNEIQTILATKQKEIKTLAKNIDRYDMFLAQVDRQDAVLVNSDYIDKTYAVSLFSTDDETQKLLASQENPYKLALDTNAGLVQRYLNTINSSTPEELGVDKETHQKTSTYLSSLSKKIDEVYTRLDLDPIAYDSCGMPQIIQNTTKDEQFATTSSSLLLAQNTSKVASTLSLSDDTSYDLSPYVRGVFVPKIDSDGKQKMINVVKSESYIQKISDNYQVFDGTTVDDLNQDGLVDVLSRDTHGVYIKYGNQHVVPKEKQTTQSHDTNYYLYAGGSSYISTYRGLLTTFYPDGNGYVPFGNIRVKLVSPYPEIKNLTVSSQGFDAVQFSWTSHHALGYAPDGYLIKLNQRIDTFTDKDKLFDLGLSQDILRKSYILFLPDGVDYTGATIDLGEKSYNYDGTKSFVDRKLISQLLPGGQYSGAILSVRYYDPQDESITASLSEIARHWQYTQIVSLKNISNLKNPRYVVASPWSNQIVVGRQIMSDDLAPTSTIFLYRPSIKSIVSQGSDHKGYVGTTYSLYANRRDNVAISKMWIQKGEQIIALKDSSQQADSIVLTGLYFTGESSLDFVFGAEDFNGNKQLDPARLTIQIPDISVKDVPFSGTSGQAIAEISHDIDQGMVVFQRERNDRRQEITGTLSNNLGGFSLKPLQTIVTGSVFSLGKDVGFYDNQNHQIGSLSPYGNMKIFPLYADRYSISLDLSAGLPALRVLDKQNSDTLFWVHLPPKKLVSMSFGQQAPFYQNIPLQGTTFRGFDGGTCVQNSTKQCVVYISKAGVLYIPQEFISTLRGTYFYDTKQDAVVYTIRDAVATDSDPYIVQITLKVNILD